MANAHPIVPEKFLYLKGGRGRDPALVLEENFKLNALATRPVIWDTCQKLYYVFQSWPSFWAWRDEIPVSKQCFDEVIFGTTPQRLKFDIDVTDAKIDAIDFETVRAFAGDPPPIALEENDAPVDDVLAGIFALDDDDCSSGADEFDGFLADVFTCDDDDCLAEIHNDVKEMDDFLAELNYEEVAEINDDNSLAEICGQPLQRKKVDAIIRGLINVVLEEFQGVYIDTDVAMTAQDLVVMESSGPVGPGYKYSFHIIVLAAAVANNEEAKGFTAQVLSRLPAAIRELVDPQVNKSLQNFRLVGSSKPGSNRVMTVTTRFGTADPPRADTIIRTPPGVKILPPMFAEGRRAGVQARLPDLPNEDLRTVLNAVARARASIDHEFLRVQGDLFIFRRVRPGFCFLCDRVHEHDNTLIVKTVLVAPAAAPDGVPAPHRVVEYCRRKSGAARDLAIIDLAPRVPYDGIAAPGGAKEAQARVMSCIESRIAAIQTNFVDPHLANATRLENLPQRLVYSEPNMRAYSSVPTLAVKGQMKLGKTKALREYLDHDFPVRPGGLHTPVIRMVTFRQTFSKSMQREHFRDFELYSDHSGDLDHIRFPRLIVQVESLHRLQMGEAPEPIDLLILDEVESILAQFNSGLHKRFNAAFAMFKWMLATAKHVICIDANIGDRTLRVLEHVRPNYPVTFHWNQFQRAEGDQFYFSADKSAWLDHLFDRLSLGQRIVLPTNSLAEARTLWATINARHPDKNVRLYSSETPPSEKEHHFADVHAHWSNLDVLIFTPTISAGVSYELEHFDVLFGLFNSASCCVETCRQMLARVRNIATKEHFIHLSGGGNRLPTNVDTIRRLLFDKRANLYRTIDNRAAPLALQFEYGADGDILFHESSYFILWLETARIENLSANAFVNRFIDQVADTGATVAPLTALPGADERLARLKTEYTAVKLELTERESAAIAAAPEFSPDEVAQIRDQLSRQLDVSEPDRLGVQKYQLRETYRWHGRPIDSKFITTYGKPEVSCVYRNLLRVTAEDTVANALREIQNQEAASNNFLMQNRLRGGDAGESRDLHHRYVFQSHFLAIWLLQICGFSCIRDPAHLHEVTVYTNLREQERALLEKIPHIEFEFRHRCPNIWMIAAEQNISLYVAKILAIINRVLRKMYGIAIQRVTGAEERYFHLTPTRIGRLFVFSREPVPDDAPDGPKPHIPSRLGGGD